MSLTLLGVPVDRPALIIGRERDYFRTEREWNSSEIQVSQTNN